MIAVIADDFTGAAELGGIGLTYGLAVELAMGINPDATADLIVVATDARSVPEAEAVAEMTEVSQALRAMNPRLIFKKIDSVLRGHVIAETKAQLAVLGLEKALLVPANPALGRILIDGHYYVQGELIHKTHFSEDPEFPITDSNVQNRFAGDTIPVTVQPPSSALLAQGITIGEVGKQADFNSWIDRLDEQTLVGGGAGFFTALLDSIYGDKRTANPATNLGEHRLYVCGTAFGKSVKLVKKAAIAGHAVNYMPGDLMQASSPEAPELTRWVTDILGCFQRHNQVIIAIDSDRAVYTPGLAVHLRTVMGNVVSQVLKRMSVDELIIEGGSTAAAVLRAIGVTRLAPVQELGAGVVRSVAIGKRELHITVKPGSYRWPPDLWTF
ncbi:four-carbon acid sugar kinase family protein [Spirosoma koreense]